MNLLRKIAASGLCAILIGTAPGLPCYQALAQRAAKTQGGFKTPTPSFALGTTRPAFQRLFHYFQQEGYANFRQFSASPWPVETDPLPYLQDRLSDLARTDNALLPEELGILRFQMEEALKSLPASQQVAAAQNILEELQATSEWARPQPGADEETPGSFHQAADAIAAYADAFNNPDLQYGILDPQLLQLGNLHTQKPLRDSLQTDFSAKAAWKHLPPPQRYQAEKELLQRFSPNAAAQGGAPTPISRNEKANWEEAIRHSVANLLVYSYLPSQMAQNLRDAIQNQILRPPRTPPVSPDPEPEEEETEEPTPIGDEPTRSPPIREPGGPEDTLWVHGQLSQLHPRTAWLPLLFGALTLAGVLALTGFQYAIAPSLELTGYVPMLVPESSLRAVFAYYFSQYLYVWLQPALLAATAALTILGIYEVRSLFPKVLKESSEITEEDFEKFVEKHFPELSGDRDRPGILRLMPLPKDPDDPVLKLKLYEYTTPEAVHLLPGLIRYPWQARRVIRHAMKHFNDLRAARGPPRRGSWRNLLRLVLDEVLPFFLYENIPFFVTRKTVSERPTALLLALERAMAEWHTSFHLVHPYEILIGSAEDLDSPKKVRDISQEARSFLRVSQDQAAIQVVHPQADRMRPSVQKWIAQDPMVFLEKRQNRRRYFFIHLRNPEFLPPKSEQESQGLAQAVQQVEKTRYEQIQASQLSLPALMALPKRLVDREKSLWKQLIQKHALDRSAAIQTAQRLYDALNYKGLALLPLPKDPDQAALLQRFFMYWRNPEDGGNFQTRLLGPREGLKDSYLLLGKFQPRVQMPIRFPRPLTKTILAASSDPQRHREAIQALQAAGMDQATLEHILQNGGEIDGTISSLNMAFLNMPEGLAREMETYLNLKGIRTYAPKQATKFLHNLNWILGIDPTRNDPDVLDGQGASVSVEDTGSDSEHPALQGAVQNWTPIKHEDLKDYQFHGSHVVGIILARIVQTLQKFYAHARLAFAATESELRPAAAIPTPPLQLLRGVLSKAFAYVSKVFGRNSEGANLGDILQGREWGLSHRPYANNESLGGSDGPNSLLPEHDEKMEQIQRQQGLRVTVPVGAAGNSGRFRSVGDPANGRRRIAVAATTVGEVDGLPEIAQYSSMGPVWDDLRGLEIRKVNSAKPGGDVFPDANLQQCVFYLKGFAEGILSVLSGDAVLGQLKHCATSLKLAIRHLYLYLSGTSMGAPADTAVKTGILRKAESAVSRLSDPKVREEALRFFNHHTFDIADAVDQAASTSMGPVPLYRQGPGYSNLPKAYQLAAESFSKPNGWQWIQDWVTLDALELQTFDAVREQIAPKMKALTASHPLMNILENTRIPVPSIEGAQTDPQLPSNFKELLLENLEVRFPAFGKPRLYLPAWLVRQLAGLEPDPEKPQSLPILETRDKLRKISQTQMERAVLLFALLEQPTLLSQKTKEKVDVTEAFLSPQDSHAFEQEWRRNFQELQGEALKKILGLASHDSWIIRRNAAFALRNFKDPQAIPVLQKLAGDEDVRVRVTALYALSDLPDPQLTSILQELKSSPRPEVRMLASAALMKRGEVEDNLPEILKALSNFKKPQSKYLREATLVTIALLRLSHPVLVRALRARTEDAQERPALRQLALQALNEAASPGDVSDRELAAWLEFGQRNSSFLGPIAQLFAQFSANPLFLLRLHTDTELRRAVSRFIRENADAIGDRERNSLATVVRILAHLTRQPIPNENPLVHLPGFDFFRGPRLPVRVEVQVPAEKGSILKTIGNAKRPLNLSEATLWELLGISEAVGIRRQHLAARGARPVQAQKETSLLHYDVESSQAATFLEELNRQGYPAGQIPR